MSSFLAAISLTHMHGRAAAFYPGGRGSFKSLCVYAIAINPSGSAKHMVSNIVDHFSDRAIPAVATGNEL